MVRGSFLVAAACFALGCARRDPDDPRAGLVLCDFSLVDVERGETRRGDVVIERGRVVFAPSAGVEHRVIEGRGRFLLPALWDLKAALWGNNSARNWQELSQELGMTQCLRVQLSYGVAHVGASNMGRDWVKREAKRAEALELDAAELLYPDKSLCAPGGENFACHFVPSAADAADIVTKLAHLKVTHLVVHYAEPKSKVTPAVSRPVLERALSEARRFGLRSVVTVDTWEQAEEVADLGGSVIFGLPAGVLSDTLIRELVARGVAYAPNLAGYLELPRLLGHADALADPFLGLGVPREILATFEREPELWETWRPYLAQGRTRQHQALEDLARLARAGVRLLSATDAGWGAGTFQGYSAHATQAWMERAGLEPWTRLRAATIWPAALFGRHVGFRAGDPADFVAVTEDPTSAARALRALSFVVHDGHEVALATLRPDVTRSVFRP